MKIDKEKLLMRKGDDEMDWSDSPLPFHLTILTRIRLFRGTGKTTIFENLLSFFKHSIRILRFKHLNIIFVVIN